MNKEQVTARDLAHLIGLLSSTIPAVNVAPLHYRAIQRLRHKALSVTGDYDRSTAITDETRKDNLVDRQAPVLQRSLSCPTIGGHDNHNRCVPIGMGCNRPVHQDWRRVDEGREESSHQPAGNESSAVRLTDVRFDKSEYPHSLANRQLHNDCVHKPQRRHSFQGFVRSSSGNMGLVYTPPDLTARRTYSWCGQRDSRCGIQKGSGTERLDVGQRGLQHTTESMGSVRSGPFCSTSQCTAPTILQLQTGSGSRSSRCSIPSVDEPQSICFPSLCPDREMSQKAGSGSSGGVGAGSAFLVQPTLVSKSTSQTDRYSLDPTTFQPHYNESNGRDTPTGYSGKFTANRLQSFRSSVQGDGISDDSFKIICAAWRKGTEKSYSSAWGKWLLWCDQGKSDPFPSSIGPVLNFLTSQFEQGKQYSTLNSYRSALSATLPQIDGKQVGQHPMVIRLLQGMFNQRPPAPKYQEVWDVGLVVKYIQDGPRTADLSLKELSKRTVTLLALCNASRASDIQALDIRFKRSVSDNMVFTIPGLTKTRRSGPPKQVFFYAFQEAESLCPVKTIATNLH